MMSKRGWIKSDERVRNFAASDSDIINKGAYVNLVGQLNKIAKHAKGVSITAQRQYYNHMDRFCRFVADQYNLKNLANIHDKHIAAYVEERQHEGKSAATVKNDLAAIRYYHDQMPKTKYRLSDNQRLQEKYNVCLERRMFGQVNRACSEMEYQALTNLAYELNHPRTALMIGLGREQGLRIHEVVRMERALREGILTVKGKGGLIRSVPLTHSGRALLQQAITGIQRGRKLFVEENEKAHQVVQRTQDFIRNHRHKLENLGTREPRVNLTFHSLRHAYAKEQYQAFLEQGMSESDARYRTALLIGHSREDVTRIYLKD